MYYNNISQYKIYKFLSVQITKTHFTLAVKETLDPTGELQYECAAKKRKMEKLKSHNIYYVPI